MIQKCKVNVILLFALFLMVSLGHNVSAAAPVPTGIKPAIPDGLKAALTDSQVVISWNPASGAESYTVLRSTYAQGPYVPIASNVTASVYTNTGLLYGVTYHYVVQAVGASGTSGYSNEISVPVSPILAARTI